MKKEKKEEEDNSTWTKILSKLSVIEPELICQSSHNICSLCVDENCQKQAFFCGKKSCQSCQQSHFFCKSIRLRSLTIRVNQLALKRRDLFKEICNIQDSFVKAIQSSRQFLLKYCNLGLQKNFENLLQQIYKAKEQYHLTGKEAYNLEKKLTKSIETIDNESEQILQNYQSTVEKAVQNLILVKQQFYDNLLQIPQASKGKGEIQSQKSVKIQFLLNQIQSILMAENKKTLIDQLKSDQKEFLYEALNRPTKMELIFKASENEYSAVKFHQKCDNIPNTFTLVKNQHNKYIGGFSQYLWNQQNNSYVIGKKQSTFLVSLNLKEKYVPKSNEKELIMCYSRMGPTFGSGYDLCIADNCYKSNSSYSRFPTTFNLAGRRKLSESEETSKKFSGSSMNEKNHFRVEQYQVFRVSYE